MPVTKTCNSKSSEFSTIPMRFLILPKSALVPVTNNIFFISSLNPKNKITL
ncbi:hypothetical protein [Moraxella lacunata]|uniref:hypothetical protein n=1 Tax=Moraxella lacunata TaxID=477 RepID=UPI003EE401AC